MKDIVTSSHDGLVASTERASGAWKATVKLGLFMRLGRETSKCASDQAKRSDALCKRTFGTLKSKKRAGVEMTCN